MIGSTYTYALLEVSPAAYAEIKTKLEAAGYAHAFHEEDGKVVIDMHGIALVPGEPRVQMKRCDYCGEEEKSGGYCSTCGSPLHEGGRPHPTFLERQ